MRTGLIGKKIGSSSYFDESGQMVPVTLIKIDECIVLAIKTHTINGYDAVQIASIEENLKLSNVNKAQKKIFASLEFRMFKIEFILNSLFNIFRSSSLIR